MKRLSLVILLLLAGLSWSVAQRTITGTVTDEAGEPLIGASVLVQGTTSGTVTDLDGKYSINVNEEDAVLLFSYTGFSSQEVTVGVSDVIDVELVFDVLKIDEVVVTASGIERQKRDLGYSVTTIGGDELTVARETNIVNSLQGKTSGVQITNQSGNLGGSSKILIRGINSLSGNNNPLWVVDGVPIFDSNISTGDRISGGFDVGNRAQDINPDDIESINILKGAAAAALYGSRAANGAIIVTTKRGKKGNRANITFNSSVRFDTPLRLPDFQNEYAQGNNGKLNLQALNGWGPRIDGRTYTDFTGEEATLEAFPDNVNDFYETGTTYITNLAVGGGNEKSNYRFSMTALNRTGIFPGSELDRYTLSFNAGTKFDQKINSSFGINLVRTTSAGNVAQGGNDPNVLSSTVNSFPRNLDISKLTPWIDESTGVGQQLNPLTDMTNNPYWIANENRFDTEVDRMYGNFTLQYEPVIWFDITSRLGMDFVVDDRFRSNRVGTLGRAQGDFTTDQIQQRQLDYNLLATVKRPINDDFFIKAIVGFNYNNRVLERFTNFAQQLTVEELFSVGNVSVNSPINDFTERRLFGVYGDITLSYKDYLSLNVTGRNDWTSTLPIDNNSYFYPSVNLSFVFTDAFNISNNILSYGKIRASYAQVGGDTNPYQLNFLYTPQADAFGQFGTGTQFPFNGTLAFGGPATIPPGDDLLPESVNSVEFGLELQFFKGRLGLDATYYDVQTTDQILAIAIPESTGFNFRRQNVGATSNTGIELELNANIIRTKDFNWNSLITFTSNRFVVDELAPGVDRLIVNSGFNSLQVIASPGEQYGLFGNTFLKASSDSTAVVVNPNTGLRQTGPNERLGNVFPDFVAGWSNNLSYKGLSLRFTFDWRQGGLLYSETVQSLRASGLAAETAVNREAAFVDTEAFIENPDGTLTPNNIPVRAEDFWNAYSAGNIGEGNVFDASFIKLREVSISYQLPTTWLENSPVSGLSIGFEARNLAIIYSAIPHIDPETNLFGAANDGAGIEFNSPPTARSLGANLRVTF
ncbi:MAG: SusC/RagA family TonB-linked outer membrane protein [Saprospiraceae bacterium]|nr:SusC/RagA family TonB-linked outer membrane protein [Saprospiraceae bacterium]